MTKPDENAHKRSERSISNALLQFCDVDNTAHMTAANMQTVLTYKILFHKDKKRDTVCK
jgi:hypothetical protein